LAETEPSWVQLHAQKMKKATLEEEFERSKCYRETVQANIEKHRQYGTLATSIKDIIKKPKHEHSDSEDEWIANEVESTIEEEKPVQEDTFVQRIYYASRTVSAGYNY
jgi:hypothetical protein